MIADLSPPIREFVLDGAGWTGTAVRICSQQPGEWLGFDPAEVMAAIGDRHDLEWWLSDALPDTPGIDWSRSPDVGTGVLGE